MKNIESQQLKSVLCKNRQLELSKQRVLLVFIEDQV